MIKNIINILGKVLEYIYDFLFDWKDEPYNEQEFLEQEKLKHSAAAFGDRTADYINRLEQEVASLVDEHDLVRENIIRVVIPPEKFRAGGVSPQTLEETIMQIYSQYNRDIILKPGRINVMNSSSGATFAEIEMECYKLSSS